MQNMPSCITCVVIHVCFNLNFTAGLCSSNAPCFVLSSFWLEILLYILFSLTFFKDDIHVFWLICYYIISD
jgi:hypothetical protein